MNLHKLEKGVLIIHFAAAAGGSLFFECETVNSQKFTLLFTQHVMLDDPNPEMLPGRIYLNQNIVALKSEDEKIILKGITNFSISQELMKNDSKLDYSLIDTFDRLCHFYKSNASLEIKEKVDNNM
jgi:hypothetical protein